MFGFKKNKCSHEWVTSHRSNIVQLDEMGYPLRLFLLRCRKCGETDQQWIDSAISTKDSILKWEREYGLYPPEGRTVDPDAKSPKHGLWERINVGNYEYPEYCMQCSECGEMTEDGWESPYCPNCGAKMTFEGEGGES